MDLLDLIVTSAEKGVTKPNTRIYQIALERLAITPAEAVFVDDTTKNVEAARTLGIRSIPCCSSARAIANLEALLAECGIVRG